MITKSDFQSVHRAMMAEGRSRLGDPPTPDQLQAYVRGELPAAEEERIRELLVFHPELVRMLTEPFPAEGAQPGDPDYMSEHEYARHWAALQKNLPKRQAPRAMQFWRASAALAAALALVFGGLLWKARSELDAPRAGWEEPALTPDAVRGTSSDTARVLSGSGETYVLVLMTAGEPRSDRYRVELVDAAGERLWTGVVPERGDTDTLSVSIPRAFLKPGDHKIVLYGVKGANEERLHAYSIRVPRR